ncbi:competence protein ComGF [Bacillus stratosphericus]|nr:competence protein ComGF [Bacillus stratosphericus]KML52691.1 competence protein ComGF [Bacillus stratosphericus]
MFHTKYKKRRRFAFDIWSDEQGFTLAQAIWQLQLFLLLSFGCMLLLSIVEKAHPFAEINKFSQMEWKQTVLQLEEDLNCAVAVRAVKNGTALEYISSQGRVVTIEPYQEMLRKRTDQAGHLPLLQKVKQFHVRTKEQTTTLQVTDLFGQVHEAVFFTYKGVIPKT